jgi:ferredoxin-NADP reductase/uncharacterized protein YcbX
VVPHVEQLFHYPVKGLSGVELAEAYLTAGRGLPYDRAVAVSNGTALVPRDGSWVDPAALLGLARNPGLTRLSVDLAAAPGTPVTITAPDGSSLVVHLDDVRQRDTERAAADAQVQSWIPAGPVCLPEVVVADTPLWEHRDAAVSIVNLATVEQLGKAWRTTLDPRRFRANVYLGGLEPWAELALVGRRLRVGAAELEVLRPIERCPAAAVDPEDGSTGPDVAALLAADAGHPFLGVYAQVVGTGRVRRADRVSVLPQPPPSRAAPGPARPRVEWPRPVAVERVEPETERVLSLWLRDPLRLAPAIRPGQHVRLHAVDAAGPFWRSYTVSGTYSDGLVRVSIALEPGGRMSEQLEENPAADLNLLLTGPFGEVTVEPAERGPILLLSAGIGITPTVALLRELADRSVGRPVSVVHVSRTADVPLWKEVRALVARLPGGPHPVTLHLTGESPLRCRELGATPGRPTAPDLAAAAAQLPGDGLVVLACGPARFNTDVRAALRDAGVAEEAIRQEVFYSPPPSDRPHTPPVSDGPFEVRFSRSGGRATWEPAKGSLLDLAESCGLTPPADCRLAACNICATTVAAGSTAYTTPPMVPPPDGGVLICCAVPTSDVTVDL